MDLTPPSPPLSDGSDQKASFSADTEILSSPPSSLPDLVTPESQPNSNEQYAEEKVQSWLDQTQYEDGIVDRTHSPLIFSSCTSEASSQRTVMIEEDQQSHTSVITLSDSASYHSVTPDSVIDNHIFFNELPIPEDPTLNMRYDSGNGMTIDQYESDIFRRRYSYYMDLFKSENYKNTILKAELYRACKYIQVSHINFNI